jgi:NAD+ synthase (glutamine-hydrolysing)
MQLVRLGLANVDTTVGAVHANAAAVARATREAASQGAQLVAFPEQTLGGYAQEDLVLWRSFVEAQGQALVRVAAETADIDVLIAVGVTVLFDERPYPAAALVHRGRVVGVVPKEKLPTYDVFYEARTLSRGFPGLFGSVVVGGQATPFGDLIFRTRLGLVALEVCEDVWSPDGPQRRRSFAGAELVVNLSASPFRVGIHDTRRELLATRSFDHQVTLAYANLVGANDGLVFDGGGFVCQNGRVMADLPRFHEGVHVVDVDLDRTRRMRAENSTWREDAVLARELACKVHVVDVDGPGPGAVAPRYPRPPHRNFFLPRPEHHVPSRTRFCEELLDALAMGIGSYFEKTRAFETIGVALSGGRDSLLVLWLARRWVERRYRHEDPQVKAEELLRAFFMPSRFSSPETARAAETAALELGVPFVVLPIDDAVASELEAVAKMLQPGEGVTAATKQNVQARIRAERMWSWANSAQGLLLQTSNMSEKAVGYTTIGGDMEGALSVIANLPKTVVNYLLDYLLETTGSEAIARTLEKPPSAELAEDQEDERDLMPFPVLDACFALFAGEKMHLDEVEAILVDTFPEHPADQVHAWVARFGRLFRASIYKWVQTPLSLHVGNLDLDRERALQLPVVQSGEWLETRSPSGA